MTEATHPIRETYEDLVARCGHSGVREMLSTALERQAALRNELDRIDERDELTDEAKATMKEEVRQKHTPRIAQLYEGARTKLDTVYDRAILDSLPFPGGRTYGSAIVQDSAEHSALMAETDSLSRRLTGKSLSEATSGGISGGAGDRLAALRREFEEAIHLHEQGHKYEARIRALAVRRFCEETGTSMNDVVDKWREPHHHRALEDARLYERIFHSTPSSKSFAEPMFPKGRQRKPSKTTGTYNRRSAGPMVGGGAGPMFVKQRKRPWK